MASSEDAAVSPGTDKLLSTKVAKERFTDIIFSDSHGAADGFLGAGFLYYGFASSIRSRVSVCIGSGGGFVPSLLAQAQHDLALTPAATYLIDANLPDLGFGSPSQSGGWLKPENDFVRRTPNLTVLQMLSADAAKLFFEQGIAIDYLHIDGDHSTRGVIADFEDFAPLLSPTAVVSLHDLGLPSVRTAIDTILERYNNWDTLQMAEIGAGTAFLRRRPAPDEKKAATPDGQRRIHIETSPAVTQAISDSRAKSRFERWHYLSTGAYRTRYMIVADLIDREGGTVVEVGGFPNSAIGYLANSHRLVSFEPYGPADYLQRNSETAARKGITLLSAPRTVAESNVVVEHLGEFSLLWLGMLVSVEVPSRQAYVDELLGLLHLVSRAQVSVIEVPEYVPSALIWKLLQDCLAPKILRDVRLDLSQDPVAQEYFVKDGRARRRILAFSGSALAADHLVKVERCADELLALDRKADGSHADDTHRYWAGELPSNKGVLKDGLERIASVGADEPGCLTFGPYLKLPAGKYEATISYRSSGPASRPPDKWDVCVGIHTVIKTGFLPGSDGEPAAARETFVLLEEQSAGTVEVRTFFEGLGDLTIRQIAVKRVDAQPQT